MPDVVAIAEHGRDGGAVSDRAKLGRQICAAGKQLRGCVSGRGDDDGVVVVRLQVGGDAPASGARFDGVYGGIG